LTKIAIYELHFVKCQQIRERSSALAKIYGYDSPEEMIAAISNIGEQIYVDLQDINDRKQIANLKIEIDHQKREEEVINLTATSYFQQVKQEIEYINLDDFWS
jgi:predicted AAA+ superfamily ATPase